MTKNEVKNQYFNWMYQLVCSNRSRSVSYRKLLSYLNGRAFVWTIDMDENRASDGIDLRYRFGREKKYSDPMIADFLDDHPCSILEMMIALSIRCEEHIMEDSDLGDRTGQWFWNMIISLGLGAMPDSKFDERHAEEVIDRFIDRSYERNGHGSLFTVEHPSQDMRDVEIWYQMCMYLDTII